MRLLRLLGRGLGAAGTGFGRGYRTVVTRGRWFVVVAWIAAAVTITVLAPPAGGGGDFGDLVPPDSPVLRVEQRILEKFRFPVLSGTTIVLHDPNGMASLTRADSVLWALATTQTAANAPAPPPDGPASVPDRSRIIAAIPIPTGDTTTSVTYLFMSSETDLVRTVQLANQYAAHFNNQAEATAYVTGFVPGQIAQGHYLYSRLPLFELATVLLILLVVALAFRSLLAPLMVLGIAGVAYSIYLPLLTAIARLLGFEVPGQLEPVLLALLIGVVTDYCVLFFSAFRDELDQGADTLTGAREAVRQNAPVIGVAGLTVAGGTIALLAAPFGLFRALGPALAMTVLVGLAVCLLLAPAVMSILGWRLFSVLPVRGSSRATVPHLPTPRRRRRDRPRLIDRLVRRRPAAFAAAGVIVLLALAAVPLAQAKLNLSYTAALPADDGAARGAALLQQANLRGITAPTEVMVEAPGIIQRRDQLADLQRRIATQRGVTKVIGPADTPLDHAEGMVLSTDGDAARYLVIFGTDPLASTAVADAESLQEQLPALLGESGFGDARVSVTGQTLIAAQVADLTRESLEITLVAAMLVELIILALYLRAIAAPLVLLACSALSVAAALGLTTFLFQTVLGEEGLTFYAPFAAAILLIALGADYTVFSVGTIWSETKKRPLAQALLVAVPRSSQAITTAGVILAATFALVAIIPLTTFRQIAFAMATGLLIDTLVVRPILTPAVLTLMGRFAGWPTRRITVAPASTDLSAPSDPQHPGTQVNEPQPHAHPQVEPAVGSQS